MKVAPRWDRWLPAGPVYPGTNPLALHCPALAAPRPSTRSSSESWAAPSGFMRSICRDLPGGELSAGSAVRRWLTAAGHHHLDRSPNGVGVAHAALESSQRLLGERAVARTRREGPRRRLRRSVRVQLGPRRRSDQPTGSAAHQLASTCEDSSPMSSLMTDVSKYTRAAIAKVYSRSTSAHRATQCWRLRKTA